MTRDEPAVLLVEEEPAVLRLLAEALDRSGVPVLTAGRGDAAVEVFRANAGTIGLVLLDVRMHPWDGPRTLAELRRIDPEVPAAFMSGGLVDHLMAPGVVRVFDKPFPSMSAFAAELRQLAGKAS